MDPITFYNRIKDACMRRNEEQGFKGSLNIIVEDFGENGFVYKTPFSDWGDMRYMFYTPKSSNEEYDDVDRANSTIYEMVMSNDTLRDHHQQQLQESPFYKDIEKLLHYLETLKSEMGSTEDAKYIQETIAHLQSTKNKLEHYITTNDFTDKYLLLGIVDSLTYDLGRHDVPQLESLNSSNPEQVDKIREEFIETLYDESEETE